MERERAMRNDDPGAMERYFKARFGDDEGDAEEEHDAPDTTGIDQQSLLPTIRDPRLWIVRCTKLGHERKAVFSLLQKCFTLRKRGIDIGIFSAIAPEHLKGRIYIEAFSAAQVEFAISGLDLISAYGGIKAIPLDEMTDVLKLGKRPNKLANGDWVRLTRGMYKGDLAQVCNSREGTSDNVVSLRMIPRLDLKLEKNYLEDMEHEFHDDKDSGPRRKGRPPQRLFDKKELFRLTGSADVYTQRDMQSGQIYEVFNDELFRFSLLYKPKVSVKTLTTGKDVQPTVEELERWLMAEQHMKSMHEADGDTLEAEEAAQGLQLDIGSVAGRKTSKLAKGDAVKVTTGEQKGLEGKISSFDGDMVLIKVPEIPVPLRVSRSDVAKQFTVGEHVKVSNGKNAGHSGSIVRVDGDFLTIFTDSTREEIKVLSSQVADLADVNADGPQKFASAGVMRYELFDLVNMLADPTEKGVVIQVQNAAITILSTQNSRKTVPISAVKGKIRDESVRTLDARGNPIAPNDSVHVLSGPLQNRQGIVQHVAGTTVFFKARDEVNNCGILAVGARSCTASTAAARSLTSTLTASSNLKMPAPIPRGSAPSMRGRGGRGGGGGMMRDPLLRKDVKIRAGLYKGYTGKVVDTTEKTVRVELASKMKTISIAREKVRDLNDSSSNGSRPPMGNGTTRELREPNAPGSRPAPGSFTPARTGIGLSRGATPRVTPNYGNRTPGMIDRFAATPRHGSATPRAGSMTPAHGGMGSMTPAHDDFRPHRTPARQDDFGPSPMGFSTNPYRAPQTPAAEGNPYTPYNGIPQTPATPGGAGVPSTPIGGGLGNGTGARADGANDGSNGTYGGGMEPRTPAMVEPSTPAGYGGLEPRTPAPSMEPATPAPGMEPRTPAPTQEPRTPAPGMEPSTPMVQEPATPHTPAMVPQTPHGEEEASSDLGYRVLVDIEVLVKGQNNFPGVVTDAAADGSYILVRMLGGDEKGNVVDVPIADITPVQPRPVVGEKQDLVKVLDGKHAGWVGRLLSVVQGTDEEGLQGVIKMRNGEDVTLSMSLVAKCFEK